MAMALAEGAWDCEVRNIAEFRGDTLIDCRSWDRDSL
jgi:hypothetical protein